MLTGPPPLGMAPDIVLPEYCPDIPSRTPRPPGAKLPDQTCGPGCLWLEPRSAPPARSHPSPPDTAVSSGLSRSPVSGGLCRLAGHQ